MSSPTVEVIDTSQMQVLTEFPAAGFIHNNSERFRIGLLDTHLIIASCSSNGKWSGDVMFERANLAAITQLLDDVLNGRLRKEERDYVGFNSGKDRIGISAQAPRDRLTISIYNNRFVKMDGGETRAWSVTVAPDTALKMLVELEKLVAQGIK